MTVLVTSQAYSIWNEFAHRDRMSGVKHFVQNFVFVPSSTQSKQHLGGPLFGLFAQFAFICDFCFCLTVGRM